MVRGDVEPATKHQSWDSRRPSARRPSGIPFHTYPLLSAGRRGPAAAGRPPRGGHRGAAAAEAGP